MNININGRGAGRVVFKLFDDVTPKTARNFRELATGQNGMGYAKSGMVHASRLLTTRY